MDKLREDPSPPQFDRFRLQKDGLITYTQPGDEYIRICIPKCQRNLRVDIIDDHHDVPMSSHFGQAKTTNRIARRFYWHGLTKDVKVS
jgi:hypothetical protein